VDNIEPIAALCLPRHVGAGAIFLGLDRRRDGHEVVQRKLAKQQRAAEQFSDALGIHGRRGGAGTGARAIAEPVLTLRRAIQPNTAAVPRTRVANAPNITRAVT